MTIHRYSRRHRSMVLFVSIVALMCVGIALLPTGFENPSLRRNSAWESARVLAVDNEDLEQSGLVKTGVQQVTFEMTSGSFTGDTAQGTNVLLGNLSLDKLYAPGDPIIAVLRTDSSATQIRSARALELNRTPVMIVLFLLFTLFLVLFAGWTGVKALLSFVFTALAIWKLLIPALLKGYNPLLVSFCIAGLSTGVIITLISGFNRKGGTALAGSLAGIGITTVLSMLFGHFFRVPGTVKEFAEGLLYAGFLHLDLTDIFISGIFLSAAGAVMDVAMDIAASQEEIVAKHPEISARELIQSGFRVGRAVIGTMTTTLLFAYSGSFTFALMSFMAQGHPMPVIINTPFVAGEILHTMVGSFGLVSVAPITALMGGFIFTWKRKKRAE